MAADIADEFDGTSAWPERSPSALTSCGGGTASYMDAAINVLGFIKVTHPLTTLVDRGALCSSACVPIFLVGNRRVGALASLWFFHPAARRVQQGIGVTTRELLPEYTDSFITRYFVPAGVSTDWIQFMRRMIRDGDFWQTGRDLWETKSVNPHRDPRATWSHAKKVRSIFPLRCHADWCAGAEARRLPSARLGSFQFGRELRCVRTHWRGAACPAGTRVCERGAKQLGQDASGASLTH